jgi:hypothetical protein
MTFASSQVLRDSRAVFNDGRILDIITITMANPYAIESANKIYHDDNTVNFQ